MLQIIKGQTNKGVKSFFLILLFLLSSVAIFAQETEVKDPATLVNSEEHAPENKKFSAGELIIDHVADNHEWHMWGSHEHGVSVPLPIIIYSTQRGFSCFSSSRFEHGHISHAGYKLEHNKIIAVNEIGDVPVVQTTVNDAVTKDLVDISITKNVTALLFSLILMTWIFMSVAASYKRRPGEAPKGMQSLVEPLIVFVRDDIAKASIGHGYYKYLPYLLTVFFFIWINNLLGLIPIIPGGANVTGNLAITATLAVITFLVTCFSANKQYWRHVFAMPGVPPWVLIILTPIEILGVFLRPFVLMIRLFANITAGHIIALSFFSLIFIFGEMNAGVGYGVSVVSVAFVIFMTVLELLVAFLQAYVFTLLSAIYFGAAVEEHNHQHHDKDIHIAEAAII